MLDRAWIANSMAHRSGFLRNMARDPAGDAVFGNGGSTPWLATPG
jgi:hypothetical protein